jgi:ABC-type enterochelin transport system permease subunit
MVLESRNLHLAVVVLLLLLIIISGTTALSGPWRLLGFFAIHLCP